MRLLNNKNVFRTYLWLLSPPGFCMPCKQESTVPSWTYCIYLNWKSFELLFYSEYILLLSSLPCWHLFLYLSMSAQRYNTPNVRQSLFTVVDGVCKWKHYTLLTCSMSKCWSVKNIVCTTVPRLCCREKENTLSTLTHNLLLLASGFSALVICHLALLVSENGPLTKTHSVGHLCCSAATSWLLQMPASVTEAPALHSSGWGTVKTVWVSGAITTNLSLTAGILLSVLAYNTHFELLKGLQ